MSDQAGEKKTRRSKSNQVKKKKKIVRKEVRPKKESPDAELTTETVCLQAHVKSVWWVLKNTRVGTGLFLHYFWP